MAAVIGFDRKIKIAWLDAIADRAAQDNDPVKLRTYLHEAIAEDHPSYTARRKTITVLIRIWSNIPEKYIDLREQAFQLLRSANPKDRIWLHWGMCLMAYPFFNDVSIAIGRFSKLQDDFTISQVHRRLIQSWGDRATLVRAHQRVIRSMIDWQVITETGQKGHFSTTPQRTTKSVKLQVWLLKIVNAVSPKEFMEANELLTHPSIFPLRIKIRALELKQSQEFEFYRQEPSMDLFKLKSKISAKDMNPKKTGKKIKQKSFLKECN